MRSVPALFLLCAACFPGPRPYAGPSVAGVAASQFVGCYDATLPARGSDEEWTWSFALDTAAPKAGGPGSGADVPGAMWARSSEQRSSSSYWRMIPGGFQLYVGDTLHGWRAEFFPRGGELIGRFYGFSDTDDGFHAERLRVRRVPCPQGLRRDPPSRD